MESQENKFRISLTDERDEALYEEYERVIQSYGESAKFIVKRRFYEEAARPFFISPGAARNIILRMIRTKCKKVNGSRS